MTSRPPISAQRYRLWISILGAAALLGISLLAPPAAGYLWAGAVMTIFSAFLIIFPLHLLHSSISLVQIASLGCALLFGPTIAGWTTALGILLGYFLRGYLIPVLRRDPRRSARLPDRFSGLEAAFLVAMHSLALLPALWIGGWQTGAAAGSQQLLQRWPQAMLYMGLYAAIHGMVYFGDYLAHRPTMQINLPRELVDLLLLELLPLPFVWIAAAAYGQVGVGALIALGGVPAILVSLLSQVNRTRGSLERRVQELSTLNQMSQVLRSSLELEQMLSSLEQLVSQFLAVDNVFVALLNQDRDQIWYPLAVKGGQRVHWAPRPLTDRLTDRVILEDAPILLPHHAEADIERIGMPAVGQPPSAWMGVPLVSSGKTIGCLAAFSFSPETEFTPQDLELLITLSGQASVAVVNALLFEQAQRRARQLESMNRLAALISASLDPEEVLQQVCASVAQVAEARCSAIYLIDAEASKVWLARAYGFSPLFSSQNEVFSLSYDSRTRSLLTGTPALFPDLAAAEIDAALSESLASEQVQAYGDFPLLTPEGQIGFLSVYYERPHLFHPEEIELLQIFAAQAALAVANARLYARTDLALSRRAHQLSILEAVGRELSAATHSAGLFEAILDYAMEFTHSAWGMISLYDPAQGALAVKAASGYKHLAPAYPALLGIGGRAVRTQEAQNIPDVRLDIDYVDLSGGSARSQLCVPLIHKERVLGLLKLESPVTNAYGPTDQDFVSQIANQAAIALINAELYSDVTQVRDRLKAVLDSVGEGILMIDTRGLILTANRACETLTGTPVAELLDHHIYDLPENIQASMGISPVESRKLAKTLSGGLLNIMAKATVRGGGSGAERILERTASPVGGQSGQIIGWMVLLRDITAEVHSAEARELITETLVHDLRSPLSVITGALDVVAGNRQGTADDITRQAIQVARRSAQRLVGLVDALLEISQLQAGKMEINPASIAPAALFSPVLAELLPSALEYGVQVINQLTPDLPKVKVDASKITRVFYNLLDNALKFTPAGGQVVISASQAAGGMLAVQVSDTGPGIPEEYRSKIFDRFAQVPGRRGRKRGSGLGLTFCRLAVEAHGGQIGAAPRPGGGSVFTFTLPLAETGQANDAV